jgi:outer membrane protein, heavy metal efflux system
MLRASVSCAVILALGTPGVRAQTVPLAQNEGGARAPDPILGALVEEALSRNPDLLAAREAAVGARLRPDQARALSDPMLSVSYTNDGWSPTLGERDMTTLGVIWSQDLPYPGKRRLRGEILEREALQADQQVERARLSLIAAVQRAYYGLLQARALLQLVGEQGEVWRQIEGVARARYTVGQGAQQDVLRTQIEMTRVGQLEAEQSVEAEVRLAELNRLLARPADSPLDTSAAALPLMPVTEGPAQVVDRLSGFSPELKSARTAQEREALAVALARKDGKPDFAVQAGYMNRGGLDPMWQAGVGVTLPVYRKKRESAVGEAQARLRGSERRAAAIELQLRYRTQERLAQLAAGEKVAQLYEKGIVPQDRMSVEAAIANYQAGKVPFITVLEALGTLYNDRSAYVRVVAGHARARASLEEASLEATSDLPAAAPMAAPSTGGSFMGSATAGGMGSSMERP